MSFQKPAWFAAAGLLLVGAILINRSGQRELEIQAAARPATGPAHSAAPAHSPVKVPIEEALAATSPTSPGVGAGSSTGGGLPSSLPALTESIDPIAGFLDWAEQFSAADEATRERLVPAGLTLARERRAALRDLMQRDPAAALAATLSWELRRQLPPEFHQQLEQPVNGRASYEVTVSSDFENQRHTIERTTELNGRRYQTFVFGQLMTHGTASGLPVNGIALDDMLALAEQPGRLLGAAEAAYVKITATSLDPLCSVSGEPADVWGDAQLVEIAGEFEQVCETDHLSLMNAAWSVGGNGKWVKQKTKPGGDDYRALDTWSQGPKTVLFMRVNFPDDLTDPISDSAAYEAMKNVSDWIVANSYGSSAMITTVTPLLTLPNTKAFYAEVGDGQLLTDARVVARLAGYDTAAFDFDAVRFTKIPGINYGGKAHVRGKGVWLQSSSVGVIVHEFGHNYGLWHANYWNAAQSGGIGAGSHAEYGDIFDTMGSASAGDRHFSAMHRNVIDWLGDLHVRTISGDGTYRLHAFDVSALTQGRSYALKLRKDQDRDYWLELRHRFASNQHIQNGVLVRWDPWAASEGGAHLLDTTPGSPAGNSSKDDAALVLGRTFVDQGAGVFITPVAMHGAGADKSVDVVIKTGSFAGNQLPIVSVQATATESGPGEGVVFTATATDGDGDELAYEWDFGDLRFGPNSPVVTNSWSAAGEYVVRCRVSDLKGGFASAQLVVRVGNPSTFQLTGRITDSQGEPVEGVRVSNGSSSTSAYRGGFTDSDGQFIITRLAAGNHTISAALYGYNFTAAGGWSNPVTVGPSRSGIDFTATARPVVGWTILDGHASEADTKPATLRLSRTGSTSAALAVKYKRWGTATYSSDYTISPAPGSSSPYTLTIPAGASHLDVTITPKQDTISEGPETVLLTLVEENAYVIGWQAEVRIEIEDDENPGTPSVYVSSGADNRATESGNDTGSFTVNRLGNRAGDLTVFYTLGGSATPDVDYVAPPGSVVIPAGESSVAVTFAAIDDELVEGDETVVIQVTPDPAYTISSGTTVITILDDDPPLVTLAVIDDLAIEGAAGAAATAKVVVQRLGSQASPLTVHYHTSGTATRGVDFSALPGSITIPANASSATITITALNDGEIEGDETVAIVLTSDPAYNIGRPGVGIIIIRDDDLPTITLTASGATATEGGEPGEFTVARGSAGGEPLTVLLAVSGSAIPGADYEPLPAEVVIPAGSSSVTLAVVAVDDDLKEADELVTLTLRSSPQYNLGTTDPVSVTLKDNDNGAAVAVGFESAVSAEIESQTAIKLPVVLSAASASAVSVNYAVTGGTATSGADFNLAAGTLTFAANKRLATINFNLINDSAVEGDETIIITLSSPAGAVLDARTSHTLTIIDDDGAVVTITATDAEASEAGDPGNFRISRAGDAARPVTVWLHISGTASAPSDYEPLPMMVEIPAGSSNVDLPVLPVSDDTEELAETVTVRLAAVTGGRAGSPNTATVTIANSAPRPPVLPEITLTVLDRETTEGLDDPARLRFTRSGEPTDELVVHYSLSGTTTPGEDFTALSGSILIPAGQTEVVLAIQALEDGVEEPLEELVVTLASDPAYTVGSPDTATIHFVDSPFMGWQLANFTTEQRADPDLINPEADPDGDGRNNFTEYAFNLDPNEADTEPLFRQTLEPLEGSAEKILIIEYQRRRLRPDVDYVLAVAPALGQWVNNSIELEEVSVTADENGVTETVRVRVLAPTQHFSQRFVRLQVVRR
jgi:hypothetical protein